MEYSLLRQRIGVAGYTDMKKTKGGHKIYMTQKNDFKIHYDKTIVIE